MFDTLYENIGKKIKGLAVGLFIVEALASVIGGIVVMFALDDFEELAFLGLLIMVLGPIIALVGSWVLYGFGETIDYLSYIKTNTYAICCNNRNEKNQTQNDIEKKTQTIDYKKIVNNREENKSWMCECGYYNQASAQECLNCFKPRY